jgi:hypothetical protein
MEEIKRYSYRAIEDFYQGEVPTDKDGEYVEYADHKAVVETLQRENEESNKICYDNGFQDGCGESDDRHRNTIETMQNKIEELKNVIGGVYTGYYCAEHGAINGVDVTFYEKCAICGRDASHAPDSKGD